MPIKSLALNCDEIKELVEKNKLLENYIDLNTQLTPNGFDLSARSISSFDASGCVDFSNKERLIPAACEISPEKKNISDKYGWWNLKPGIYKVLTNETVNLPNDLIALAFSRTTLLRMGVFTQHGVWDAGFCGRGEFVLSVQNPHGASLKQNCRVAQLIFIRIKKCSVGYNGIYKHK